MEHEQILVKTLLYGKSLYVSFTEHKLFEKTWLLKGDESIIESTGVGGDKHTFKDGYEIYYHKKYDVDKARDIWEVLLKKGFEETKEKIS